MNSQIINSAQRVFPFLNQEELEFYLRFQPFEHLLERLSLLPKINKSQRLITSTYIIRAPEQHLEFLLHHFSIQEIIDNEEFVESITNKNIVTIK